MSDPVKLKVYLSGEARCGACDAIVPQGVKYCLSCGVPIYGRVGKGSYTTCEHCGYLIPNEEGRTKCPNCRRPFTEE